MKFKLQLI